MFNLPNPEDWYCKFVFFNRGLALDVYQTDHPIHYEIFFTTPTFIQCPMVWKGVNFRHVNDEELVAFRDRVRGIFDDKNFGREQLFIAKVDLDTPAEKTVLIKAFRAVIREKVK